MINHSNNWIFDEFDIASYEGFIYIIINQITNQKYIGKKFFYKIERKKITGKTTRTVVKSESNWRDYWGSSKILDAAIAEYGIENFSRQIIRLCKTRGETNFAEIEEQVKRDVLKAMLDEGVREYYNGNIANKYFANNTSHCIDRVHVNNGDCSKMVPNDLLVEYLSRGWVPGRIMTNDPVKQSTAMMDRVHLTKNGVNKFVRNTEVADLLVDDWIEGRTLNARPNPLFIDGTVYTNPTIAATYLDIRRETVIAHTQDPRKPLCYFVSEEDNADIEYNNKLKQDMLEETRELNELIEKERIEHAKDIEKLRKAQQKDIFKKTPKKISNIVYDKSGKKYTVDNQLDFCEIHNLTRSCLNRLMTGKISQHKGFTTVPPGTNISKKKAIFTPFGNYKSATDGAKHIPDHTMHQIKYRCASLHPDYDDWGYI